MNDVARYSRRRLPERPYVPGRGPHPARDTEPTAESGAAELLTPASWRSCETYLFGVDLFNAGFWWEAHEEFEGLWRAAGRETELGSFLQGLIQVAGALLKQSMGAPAAAAGLARAGCARLRQSAGLDLGVACGPLATAVEAYLQGQRTEPPRIELDLQR